MVFQDISLVNCLMLQSMSTKKNKKVSNGKFNNDASNSAMLVLVIITHNNYEGCLLYVVEVCNYNRVIWSLEWFACFC